MQGRGNEEELLSVTSTTVLNVYSLVTVMAKCIIFFDNQFQISRER